MKIHLLKLILFLSPVLVNAANLPQSSRVSGWTQYQSNYSGIRPMKVHSIFSRNAGQQAVFVKLFSSSELVETKNIQTTHGWIHIEALDNQVGVFFYFSHMNQSEMNQFLAQLPPIPVPNVSPSVKRSFELFPSAHAQMPQIMAFNYSGYFDVASSCAMGLGSGVYAGTVGLVVDLAEGAVECITDPVGVAMRLERTWTEMKAFFSDFQKNMSQLIDGIAALPAEAQADMLCGLVGTVGVDALIAIFTAGGGTAKLAVTVKSYLSRIKLLESTLKVFTRFSASIRKVFTADFYHRLALGKISKKRLESIDLFGRVEQFDLAAEAAACAF